MKITVTDPEHVERAFTEEFRTSLYRFDDVEEVMQHLAFNCAVNGVEDANRLDGWGDLEPGQLTMHLDRLVEYERVPQTRRLAPPMLQGHQEQES